MPSASGGSRGSPEGSHGVPDVRVICRVLDREEKEDRQVAQANSNGPASDHTIQVIDEHTVRLPVITVKGKTSQDNITKKNFRVHEVLPSRKVSTEVVYEKQIAPSVVKGALAGRPAAVLSYGAEKTGKTWTLFGAFCDGKTAASDPEAGIVPRLLKDLFHAVAADPNLWVQVAMMTILKNDSLHDLLSGHRDRDAEFIVRATTEGDVGLNASDLKEGPASTQFVSVGGQMVVAGLSSFISRTETAVGDIVGKGLAACKELKGDAVLILNILSTTSSTQSPVDQTQPSPLTITPLIVVDCSPVYSKSMHNLRDIANSIANKHRSAEYMKSNLTRLLKYSFAGPSTLRLIVHCRVSSFDLDLFDSLSSLNFSSLVMKIHKNIEDREQQTPSPPSRKKLTKDAAASPFAVSDQNVAITTTAPSPQMIDPSSSSISLTNPRSLTPPGPPPGASLATATTTGHSPVMALAFTPSKEGPSSSTMHPFNAHVDGECSQHIAALEPSSQHGHHHSHDPSPCPPSPAMQALKAAEELLCQSAGDSTSEIASPTMELNRLQHSQIKSLIQQLKEKDESYRKALDTTEQVSLLLQQEREKSKRTEESAELLRKALRQLESQQHHLMIHPNVYHPHIVYDQTEDGHSTDDVATFVDCTDEEEQYAIAQGLPEGSSAAIFLSPCRQGLNGPVCAPSPRFAKAPSPGSSPARHRPFIQQPRLSPIPGQPLGAHSPAADPNRQSPMQISLTRPHALTPNSPLAQSSPKNARPMREFSDAAMSPIFHFRTGTNAHFLEGPSGQCTGPIHLELGNDGHPVSVHQDVGNEDEDHAGLDAVPCMDPNLSGDHTGDVDPYADSDSASTGSGSDDDEGLEDMDGLENNLDSSDASSTDNERKGYASLPASKLFLKTQQLKEKLRGYKKLAKSYTAQLNHQTYLANHYSMRLEDEEKKCQEHIQKTIALSTRLDETKKWVRKLKKAVLAEKEKTLPMYNEALASRIEIRKAEERIQEDFKRQCDTFIEQQNALNHELQLKSDKLEAMDATVNALSNEYNRRLMELVSKDVEWQRLLPSLKPDNCMSDLHNMQAAIAAGNSNFQQEDGQDAGAENPSNEAITPLHMQLKLEIEILRGNMQGVMQVVEHCYEENSRLSNLTAKLTRSLAEANEKVNTQQRMQWAREEEEEQRAQMMEERYLKQVSDIHFHCLRYQKQLEELGYDCSMDDDPAASALASLEEPDYTYKNRYIYTDAGEVDEGQPPPR